MKKLEKIKQERIIKKQTKEYIESLNPMSKKQKFMEFMTAISMNILVMKKKFKKFVL